MARGFTYPSVQFMGSISLCSRTTHYQAKATPSVAQNGECRLTPVRDMSVGDRGREFSCKVIWVTRRGG